jgi:hypothetical protein
LAGVAAVWKAGTAVEDGSVVRVRARSETINSFFTTNLCCYGFFVKATERSVKYHRDW